MIFLFALLAYLSWLIANAWVGWSGKAVFVAAAVTLELAALGSSWLSDQTASFDNSGQMAEGLGEMFVLAAFAIPAAVCLIAFALSAALGFRSFSK